ncbi:hypothetical protein DFH05DRAFT_1518781 [Lentinula detonsa]|uniref:Uncharacterized protein n=1 Tax=Lentinula detonsa TaxID=2804962 RepID=A0A9W8U380_9AGAR|nr:hypothetical protein DFH05DRAFT_1518781 [Lentinula detonsa]
MPNAAGTSIRWKKSKWMSIEDCLNQTAAARHVLNITVHTLPSPHLPSASLDKEHLSYEEQKENDPRDAQLEKAKCYDHARVIGISWIADYNLQKKAVYWEKKAERLKEDKESLEEIVRDKDRVIQGKEREVVEARKEREREVDDWRREAKKRKTEAEEVKKRNNGLHERIAGYQHQIHTLKSRLTRVPERLATVTRHIACMFNAKTDHDRKFYLKEHGTIPDNTPNVLLDLVAMDKVPANKVTHVFKRIASAFGIEVEGEASRRSISWIVKEGGNASKLQIIESLKNAKGVTISGDGTMHKDETYEMKHAAVINKSNSKLQFFLGLKMATNHTSEEQLDGWIKTVEDLFHLLFESGLCTKDDAQIFWNLVTGFHSDHAADQKKLFHLLKEWKKKSDHDVRPPFVGRPDLRAASEFLKWEPDLAAAWFLYSKLSSIYASTSSCTIGST